MRKEAIYPYKTHDLTLSFGEFTFPKTAMTIDPFQRVKSQMLKRRQRLAIRKKPLEYTKLEISLQQKLKQRSFNADQQRDELVMLQKCKNYFQLRGKKSGGTHNHTSPKRSVFQSQSRPKTSIASGRNSIFIERLKGVMQECTIEDKKECQIKENMGLFTFYCSVMDKRLEGMKNNIQKKERMV